MVSRKVAILVLIKKWKQLIKSQVFINYIYLLIIQGVNFILPLIVLPYLVRILGVEHYGVVMVAQSLCVFLTIISDFGFNISATREVGLIKNNKEALSQYFWNVFFAKVILTFLAFLMLLLIVLFVDKFHNHYIVYLFSFSLVIGQSIFPTWFFQGIEKMQFIAIINLVAKLFFTISIFFVVNNKYDYTYVPLLNGLGYMISGGLGFILAWKYVYLKFPNIKSSISIVKESGSLFLSNLSVSLYTSLNTLILGLYVSESLAGVYSSMEKLVIATKNIYIPFYQALFPSFSRRKFDEIVNSIRKIKYPIAFSGMIFSFIVFIFAREILEFVFDDDFITSYYRVFQILGSIAFLASLNMLYTTLFFPAIKSYRTRLYILLLGGFFNLIMVLILVRMFSIYGVAISASLTELFLLVLGRFYYRKKT